jgi:hypothetical protein
LKFLGATPILYIPGNSATVTSSELFKIVAVGIKKAANWPKKKLLFTPIGINTKRSAVPANTQQLFSVSPNAQSSKPDSAPFSVQVEMAHPFVYVFPLSEMLRWP